MSEKVSDGMIIQTLNWAYDKVMVVMTIAVADLPEKWLDCLLNNEMALKVLNYDFKKKNH